jgi:hypothetical protein
MTGLDIRGKRNWTCEAPVGDRTGCTFATEVFTATLKTPNGNLDIKPASLPASTIAEAFRAKAPGRRLARQQATIRFMREAQDV